VKNDEVNLFWNDYKSIADIPENKMLYEDSKEGVQLAFFNGFKDPNMDANGYLFDAHDTLEYLPNQPTWLKT